MPELLVDFITSLDGYAAAEGWPGYWGLEGPEYLAWLDESPERDYTVLMGATTYRLMSGFAAESDDDSLAQLTEMSKVVFSSTLDEPLTWANTRLVDDDPVEVVRSLKADGAASGCARSAASRCAGPCSRPASSTASGWSSSPSSPAAPGGSGSTTGIPTSASS